MRIHFRRVAVTVFCCVLTITVLLQYMVSNPRDPIDQSAQNVPDTKHHMKLRPNGKTYYRNYSFLLDRGKSGVWPNPEYDEDRILTQMKLRPVAHSMKVIMTYSGVASEDEGSSIFERHECPVTQCHLTGDRNLASSADAILFQGSIMEPGFTRPRDQIWILFFLECPLHTMSLELFRGQVNWTATYRRDSTIVTPYERWTPYANSTKLPDVANKNYAANKSKKVAWFVSNCGASNGRIEYVRELSKYIDVDIYGACGNLSCPRSSSEECFTLLKRDYKFYLAFENSNCRDYITEKLYWNAYLNDVVPIVMGAHPADYKKVAPPHSYIHVDYFSGPRSLADYLHLLDKNDHLYNQYFRWKGTGTYIDTKFWCRLCSMLHEASNTNHRSHYEDVEGWWRGNGTCKGRQSDNFWSSWKDNNKS